MGKQNGLMTLATVCERSANERHGIAGRIVDFSRREVTRVARTADEQHLAVQERRRGVARARAHERRARCDHILVGVVHINRRERMGAVEPAADHHQAVIRQRRRVTGTGAVEEPVRQREHALVRIEQFQ